MTHRHLNSIQISQSSRQAIQTPSLIAERKVKVPEAETQFIKRLREDGAIVHAIFSDFEPI